MAHPTVGAVVVGVAGRVYTVHVAHAGTLARQSLSLEKDKQNIKLHKLPPEFAILIADIRIGFWN